MKFPCRHGVAYFSKWEQLDVAAILRDHVHYYFRYKALHGLYRPNICPVITDSLEYDGETLPPLEKKPAGRPKKKRYRRRSIHVDRQKSPIRCSICGKRGHNKKTCSAQDCEESDSGVDDQVESSDDAESVDCASSTETEIL